MGSTGACLIVRAGDVACAIPVAHVVEVLRPLALTRVEGAAQALSGVAVVRGAATAVLDLRVLVGQPSVRPAARWVLIQAEGRRMAAAVDAVVRVETVPEQDRLQVAPLVTSGEAPVVQEADARSEQLLFMLDPAALLAAVPQEARA